jgi:hypothetical protein
MVFIGKVAIATVVVLAIIGLVASIAIDSNILFLLLVLATVGGVIHLFVTEN